jgi:hypothetical protein
MGHHFVPQFLLRRWAEDRRFVAYYYEAAANRVIENGKATVASACQIADLNTFFGVHVSRRDFPERGFFTPHIDTPAAEALEVMMKGGVQALTITQRRAWARQILGTIDRNGISVA